MYHADLDKYSYFRPKIPEGFAIGWLDKEHSYNQGEVPSNFLDRLWNFCYDPPVFFLGFHECPFCDNPPFGLPASHNGQEITLGSGDMWVFGNNGRYYVAPNLIYHYVAAHHYCPPEEFIEAVMHSPLPGSDEYKKYLVDCGLEYT